MSRHVPLIVIAFVAAAAAWWFATKVVPASAKRPARPSASVRLAEGPPGSPTFDAKPLPTAVEPTLPTPAVLVFEPENMSGPPRDAPAVQSPRPTPDPAVHDGPPEGARIDIGPPPASGDAEGPPEDAAIDSGPPFSSTDEEGPPEGK